MKPTVWASDVMLIDVESGNQIGECWIVEVPIAQARTVADARREIRRKAWDEVDSRLNDVAIDLVDGPFRM